MNRQTRHHGYTTRPHLWVVMTVALGLALGRQAVTAKECQRETPLPADVRLTVPGPQVPEAVARFVGAWTGTWVDQGGRETQCHTLVVEEVLANGYARVIVSYGTYADRDVRLSGLLYVTGRIVDGELRFQLPLPPRPKRAYRFADDTLQATREGPGGTDRVRLSRLTDVSQVGCRAQAGAVPPAPPTTGPRDRLTAAELLASTDATSGLVHNDYFMPVGQAAPARHTFQGTVTVQASSMVTASYGCPGLAETLPGFTVACFTQGEHLVPVVRDILYPPGIIQRV